MKRILIFAIFFSGCTSAVNEINQEYDSSLEVATSTVATTTTTTTIIKTSLTTTTTSTLPDAMPTVLITCEPLASDEEGVITFKFEVTTGTNELVVLNIVSWFDSSRTDDLFISDGLPSPGSSNEFGYTVDASFSQYEIEMVVMDSKDNFANDYCLYEQNPNASNPSTTTTTSPSTTTTVPVTTSYSLKFGDQINQFPEIPYCKMQYEEVEKQLKDYFLANNIRLTIREYRVETSNTDCYGLVSGSNYSYLDEISDGKFVEITVESNSTQRRFPSTIAYSPNAIGNDEFFDLFCDLSNDYVSDKYWMGELGTGLISPYDERKYRDSLLYTSPNYGILDIDLTDPFTNCATDMRLDEMCYWRFESFSIFQPDLVIYRHYDFPAEQHYGSENVTNACSDKEIENLKNS